MLESVHFSIVVIFETKQIFFNEIVNGEIVCKSMVSTEEQNKNWTKT